MRAFLAATALLIASSAMAQECSTFTSETRPQGEITAEMVGDRQLVIRDEYAGTTSYDLISAGTGIPFQVGVPEGETPEDGNTVKVRMLNGDLVIDMIAYEPFCR